MQMNESHNLRTARESVKNSSGLAQLNFLSFSSKVIRSLVAVEQNQVDLMRQELALLNDSRLCIHRSGDHAHYYKYEKSDQSLVGISKDTDLVYELARRAFLENRIKATEANARRLLTVLECAEGLRDEVRLRKKLGKYADAGLDLSRILFTKEQNEWIDAPCSPNPFYQEHLKYPTKGGVLMRSNAEVAIGNVLESIGWPYRYDDLVTIQSGHTGDRPYKDSYFADIKVPNLIGGITIHEHFGAFQIENYADNSLKRLNDYRNFKVYELPEQAVLPEEFTWSLMADLRDSDLLRQVIQRMLLPCGV